jgi:hypothetical protein
MKTSKIVVSIMLIAGVALLAASCKKKNETTPNSGATWATDQSKAENTYEDVSRWSDKAMSQVKLKSTLSDTVWMGTCVLATLDISTLPYRLTIDFGATNCLCDDGKYRRGKIICTFNGDYYSAGTTITYTFEDYFVNDYQVLGTKTVTNMGRNSSNHLWWQITVTGQIVKPNNGGTFYWNSTRQNEWLEGEGQLWYKWVYLITGSAWGTQTDGKTYNVNITAPLKFKFNCEWICSGTLTIQPQDQPLITVDYGDGTCDNVAIATINGTNYTIYMN